MAKIESLKNYIGVLNEDEFIKLSKQIYDITDFICEDYPKHKEWYFHKQIPRIFTPSGEILFARSEEDENKIIAMACLKKDEEEQKICTLYVSDQCRGQRLKEFRKSNEITQTELANILNTTQSTISAYESGKTTLLTAFALEIVNKYNISLDWLCGRK